MHVSWRIWAEIHPCDHCLAQIISVLHKKVSAEGFPVVAGFFLWQQYIYTHIDLNVTYVLPVTLHYKAVHVAMALIGHKLNLCKSYYSFVTCFSHRLIWDARFMPYVRPANHWLLGLLSRQSRNAEKLVEDMVTLPVSCRLLHTLIRRRTVMFMCSLNVVVSWCVSVRNMFRKFFFPLVCVFKAPFIPDTTKKPTKPIQHLHQHLDGLYVWFSLPKVMIQKIQTS